MSIPKVTQDIYNEISTPIKKFCAEHLNDEYLSLCLHVLEKLCRKRTCPLSNGHVNTWAAGIVYSIGQLNFLFDKTQPNHCTAEELSSFFGCAKSTAANKAAEIRKLLKMTHLSPEWAIESRINQDPLFWFVSVNGFDYDARTLPLELQTLCFQKGLIPYIPGVKDKKTDKNKK